MEFEVEDVPEGTYAVIKRTVPFSEVPAAMGELIGQVQAWAATAPHGRMMNISSRTPDGQLNLAPGVEVEPGAVDPPEPFEVVTRPAQRSAVYLHVGGYEQLPDIYMRFYDAILAAGLKEGGAPIEIYETHDPVPETRIIWPLSP